MRPTADVAPAEVRTAAHVAATNMATAAATPVPAAVGKGDSRRQRQDTRNQGRVAAARLSALPSLSIAILPLKPTSSSIKLDTGSGQQFLPAPQITSLGTISQPSRQTNRPLPARNAPAPF